MNMPCLLANIFGGWGFVELAVLMIVGVLIFGKRLPEVGKNLGKSIVEFKKGMSSATEAITAPIPAEQPRYITAEATAAQSAPLELPAGQGTSLTEESLRRQEQELQRMQNELKQLREQLAQKSAGSQTPTA